MLTLSNWSYLFTDIRLGWFVMEWWDCIWRVRWCFTVNPSLHPSTGQVIYRPSIWRWMCFFSRASWLKAELHIVHLNLYSSCIFIWCSKWTNCTNFSSQRPQAYGNSSPWVLRCCCRWDCCLKVFSGQWGHIKPRIPVCRARCWFNWLTWINRLGHWLHTYCCTLWCVFMWLLRFVTWAKDRPQSGSMQTNGLSPVWSRRWLFKFVTYEEITVISKFFIKSTFKNENPFIFLFNLFSFRAIPRKYGFVGERQVWGKLMAC